MKTPHASSHIFAVLLLLAGMLSMGCDRKRGEPEPARPTTAAAPVVIGYSAPEWGGGQFLIMEGLRDRAQAKGWEVMVVNANFDPDVQERQIDYMIDQNVKAVVVVPLDSQKISKSIQHAREHGVLFYTIDRAPSEGQANMVVQADNRVAGRQAGECLLEWLQARNGGTARGKVLELQGELTQTVALERGNGFHEALQGQQGITIIQKETHWQAERFASAAEEAVVAGGIDAIYLHSDMIGIPEVLPVLKRLGQLFPRDDQRHVFIAGIDGGPPALQAIRDGLADCAVSQPLTDYGMIVQYIDRGLRGEKITEGMVEQPDAPWSPAQIIKGPNGPVLQMRTTPVTEKNVYNQSLWGNQFDRAARKLRQN